MFKSDASLRNISMCRLENTSHGEKMTHMGALEEATGAHAINGTWLSMAFLFLGSLTTDSCSSAIFFILLSMSIF